MPIRKPTYFAAITRFHRFSPGFIYLTEILFTRTANKSIKNLCKVMIVADISLDGLAMCDLEREAVRKHRALTAKEPVKGYAVVLADFCAASMVNARAPD